MLKKHGLVFSFVFLLSSFAAADVMTVVVNPISPIVMPVGSVSINGHTYQAPFFILNSVSIAWSGLSPLKVLLLQIKAKDKSYDCAVAADALASAFPNNVGSANQVFINSNTVASSLPIVCDNLTLPVPTPSAITIPVEATVTGVSINQAGQHLANGLFDFFVGY